MKVFGDLEPIPEILRLFFTFQALLNEQPVSTRGITFISNFIQIGSAFTELSANKIHTNKKTFIILVWSRLQKPFYF